MVGFWWGLTCETVDACFLGEPEREKEEGLGGRRQQWWKIRRRYREKHLYFSLKTRGHCPPFWSHLKLKYPKKTYIWIHHIVRNKMGTQFFHSTLCIGTGFAESFHPSILPFFLYFLQSFLFPFLPLSLPIFLYFSSSHSSWSPIFIFSAAIRRTWEFTESSYCGSFFLRHTSFSSPACFTFSNNQVEGTTLIL